MPMNTILLFSQLAWFYNTSMVHMLLIPFHACVYALHSLLNATQVSHNCDGTHLAELIDLHLCTDLYFVWRLQTDLHEVVLQINAGKLALEIFVHKNIHWALYHTCDSRAYFNSNCPGMSLCPWCSVTIGQGEWPWLKHKDIEIHIQYPHWFRAFMSV